MSATVAATEVAPNTSVVSKDIVAGPYDVNGDGLLDCITGKRFWSHLDTYLDPNPHGSPVQARHGADRDLKVLRYSTMLPRCKCFRGDRRT